MASKKDYQPVRNSQDDDDIEMDRMRGGAHIPRPPRAAGQDEEDKRLMYDVDEEGRRESYEDDRRRMSDDMDKAALEKYGGGNRRKSSLLWRFCKWSLISFALLLLFILLGGGAYKASGKNFEDIPYVQDLPIWNSQEEYEDFDDYGDPSAVEEAYSPAVEEAFPPAVSSAYRPEYRSNGTSLFAPTTILISLDGFRADYLSRGITPGLDQLVREGVSAPWMKPSFPSVTFPNHYTMVTGLNPESHGIVGNNFYDPELQEEFYYTNPEHSMQPKWWSQAEPLWVTAEDQGVRTAIHMWPGSEAHIPDIEPTYIDQYNGTERLGVKVNRIVNLMQLPGPQELEANPDLANGPLRPQFVAAYVPDVDRAGHRYGPDAPEMNEAIATVDLMVRTLVSQLNVFNLSHVVNFVVVSDHGMAQTSTDRLIQLEDLIDPELISTMEGWPSYGIRLKDTSETHLETIYNRLLQQTAIRDGFDVYLTSKTMPERYHFTQNSRIAPLWLIPKAGWAIVTKDEIDVATAKEGGDIFHPLGIHGYDNEDENMRAIFLARGPAFPHRGQVEPFQNTEVYNIVCDSLGVEPRPNNGTLRLPLKVFGGGNPVPGEFISDEDAPPFDFTPAENWDESIPVVANQPAEDPAGSHDPPTAVDPPVDAAPMATDVAGAFETAVLPQATPAVAGDSAEEFDSFDPAGLTPEEELELEIEEEEAEAEMDLKEWMGDEWDGFKEWVNDLFGGHGADSEDMIEDIIEDNAEFLDVDAGVGDMAADMDDTYA